MFFGINGLVSKSFSDKQTPSIKILHDTPGSWPVNGVCCVKLGLVLWFLVVVVFLFLLFFGLLRLVFVALL